MESPDEWLAIKYPRGWYVGQFVEYDEEDDLILFHFLKKVSSSSTNRFSWPELEINGREDKAYVEESNYYFFLQFPMYLPMYLLFQFIGLQKHIILIF